MTREKQRVNRLMSVEKAADYLDVAEITVRRMIERGTIFPIKIPGVKRVFVDQLDLDRLIQEAKDPKKCVESAKVAGEGG